VFDTASYVKSAAYQATIRQMREERPLHPAAGELSGNEKFRELRARLPALRRKALRID
jgi:hypothetical protein